MQDDLRASAPPPGLDRLLDGWSLDAEALERLRALRPPVGAALVGIEAEIDETFLSEPRSEHGLADVAARHAEVERIARLWHALFRTDPDPAMVERAEELGRHHADLGLDGRVLLQSAQAVLRRALSVVVGGPSADAPGAIDALTRLVLFAADLAVNAIQARRVERLTIDETGRAAEELQEQIQALEELARIDGLTKLFNRRHFDTALDSEVSRAHRHHLPLCLIMADVDFFKRINDNYGHAVGDEVLCHVAEVLQSGARRSDLVARYGGEEFVVILTSTPGEHAALVAERMRTTLEQRPVAFADGQVLRPTISLGVAVLQPDDTPRSLLGRADAALYQAKETGRNRVCG